MLTEEQIRAHYKHKCNTGYDPLLCVHLTYYPFRMERDILRGGILVPKKDPDNRKGYREIIYHVVRIITEDRYVDLIKTTKTETINDLKDWDKLEVQNVWLPSDGADLEDARIFWLRPTGKCKTLTDLFNVYKEKIKEMFKEEN